MLLKFNKNETESKMEIPTDAFSGTKVAVQFIKE